MQVWIEVPRIQNLLAEGPGVFRCETVRQNESTTGDPDIFQAVSSEDAGRESRIHEMQDANRGYASCTTRVQRSSEFAGLFGAERRKGAVGGERGLGLGK
jgi:hypothetical protein